jgi:hypothetical protein
VRDATKAALTIAQRVQQFLAEHVEAKTKERTTAEYRRLLDKLVLPTLGRLKVSDVGRMDVARLHHKLGATPYQANRALALLSKLQGKGIYANAVVQRQRAETTVEKQRHVCGDARPAGCRGAERAGRGRAC